VAAPERIWTEHEIAGREHLIAAASVITTVFFYGGAVFIGARCGLTQHSVLLRPGLLLPHYERHRLCGAVRDRPADASDAGRDFLP